MDRPELLVFDVNETLLDIGGLRPAFAEALGSTDAMGEWFARMLHASLVANHTGRYRSFGELGVEALQMVASKRGVPLTDEAALQVVSGMRDLPPHPDVVEGMEALAAAGYRMITLTNGSTDAVVDQVTNSGLAGFFDFTLSVDRVERFKPAPEVYLSASVATGVEMNRMLMVAAHDWDIVGARSVGMPGAYIDRPSAVWSVPDDRPDIDVPDIIGLAAALT